MTDDEKISNFGLFALGLSAGLLACYFPRLMTQLTSGKKTAVISLFTPEFLITTLIVSVIIGLSMLWFYANTVEQPKNVFIAALALPAVLSGGINMSNLSSAVSRDIINLNSQTIELQSQLEKIIRIESVVINESNSRTLSFLPSFIPFGEAHAAEPRPITSRFTGLGIKTTVDSLDQNVYVLHSSSTDRNKIFQTLKMVNQNSLGGEAYVYIQNDTYYLLLSGPTTKSNALIEAIKLKSDFGFSPKLLVI